MGSGIIVGICDGDKMMEMNVEMDMEEFKEEAPVVTLEVKTLDKKAMVSRIVFIAILLFLIVLIVKAIGDYSPYFDATVTEFSDDAPRVGNNIYGYIDVPDGFVMTGSFDPENVNYVGGADGIAEGVQLKNTDGTMYIIVSVLTPDKNRDDYIGLGDGLYQEYEPKGFSTSVEDVFGIVVEDLLNSEVLEMDTDGLVAESGFVDVNGLRGMSAKWKGVRDGKEYYYQTHILENPEKKEVFHCVTAVFTPNNTQCVDYVQTFSLTSNKSETPQFVGVGDRVGSKVQGYMNIPKGFIEYKGALFYEMMEDMEKDVDLSYYASEHAGDTELPIFEGMVHSSFSKGDKYDSDPKTYMEVNLQELYGSLGVLDYLNVSNVTLQGDSKEFGAEAFLSVMQQTLGVEGTFNSQPAEVDGNKGYRVTWSGRGKTDRIQMYLSFYVLESAHDSNVVYIIGAKERTLEGQFWQYLDSFRVNDQDEQSTKQHLME